MPTSVPMPTKAVGDVFTTTLWNSNLRDNINKLLNLGHRVLTVAQFAALSSPEGTKGTVAPDEVYVEADSTNGVVWHCHYESTDASSSKWRFLGGPALYSEVATSEATASTTYVALTTAGPAITLPRLGDYDVTTGLRYSAGAGNDGWMSYDIGGTGAVDADAAVCTGVTGATLLSVGRSRRKTGLTAVTLTAKYKSPTAASVSFISRFMAVTPVRIG